MGHTIVAHCRKVKTGVGLANVAAHNSRLGVYMDNGAVATEIPPWVTRLDRAHLNKGNQLTDTEILGIRARRLRDAEKTNRDEGKGWRKPQANAAAAVEIVISASPGWFEGKAKGANESAQKAFFDDAREYLAKRYGAANVLHWATHYDEKTPHMHMLLVPIVATEKGYKYSSGEFLGGRQGLQALQSDIAAKVGAKWGLERGQEGSKARHTDQYDLAKQNIQKAKELAEREASWRAREAVQAEVAAKSADRLEEAKAAETRTAAMLSEIRQYGATGQLVLWFAKIMKGLDIEGVQAAKKALEIRMDEIRPSLQKGQARTPDLGRSR